MREGISSVIAGLMFGVSSLAGAQTGSAPNTVVAQDSANSKVKTSDKHQAEMLQFVKGREAPPSTGEPTGGKPTDGGVYEDPDAGGEVSPALAKPTSASGPTELKRASEGKLQVGQVVPQGLRNYVPYRRLPQNVQQQVKKGSRYLVLEGNILYEVDPKTDEVTNSYSTDYPLLRQSLSPE